MIWKFDLVYYTFLPAVTSLHSVIVLNSRLLSCTTPLRIRRFHFYIEYPVYVLHITCELFVDILSRLRHFVKKKKKSLLIKNIDSQNHDIYYDVVGLGDWCAIIIII